MNRVRAILLAICSIPLVATPALSQDRYFSYAYNWFKTNGLSQVMFECDLARRYINSIKVSYWSYGEIMKRRRRYQTDDEQKFNAIESAKTAVMRETCPDVW